jgi:hypothetical protein
MFRLGTGSGGRTRSQINMKYSDFAQHSVQSALASSSQGFSHTRMNLEKRANLCEVEKVHHKRPRICILQLRFLLLSVPMQQYELADSGTIDRTDAAEIENNLPSFLQNFPYDARKCIRLFAIYNAPLAVNNHDFTALPSFQTKLQLRLLGLNSWGRPQHRLWARLTVGFHDLHPSR